MNDNLKGNEELKEVVKESENKVDKDIKPIEIDLVEFNKLSSKEQYDYIEKTLENIYKGSLKIRKKHVLKCISLSCDSTDATNYLPYGLKVDKITDKLTFMFVKKSSTPTIILFLVMFLLATLGATYAGFRYYSLAQLNLDIDGDGIADINIDINANQIADINIDTLDNKKNKVPIPDVNIDYKGNRVATFNVDTDDDGKADFNLVNVPRRDSNNNYTCVNDDKTLIYNCDTNKDGWPDINLDVYGDGSLILDRDTDGNNIPDLNIDRNGDKVCDFMCDTNKDDKCDMYCVNPDNLDIETYSGTTIITGNPNQYLDSATLLVVFESQNEVRIEDIFPDDQHEYSPGAEVTTDVPELNFTVENLSPLEVKYKIKWIVKENTFLTTNFQYQLTREDIDEVIIPWKMAPKIATVENPNIMATDLTIGSKEIQTYSVDFRLRGTGQEQNIDQGKTFYGQIEVEIIR